MAEQVVVVGAGASGMIAAIAAARKGARVTILESQDHAGKKLLVTGNGRCNLTNLSETLPISYHGTGAGLAARLTGKFGAEKTLSFFKGLGLLTIQKNGWVYPHTQQASSVLSVLMSELGRLHVNMKFNQKILKILDCKDKGDSSGYDITTTEWNYHADAVILACGSMAAPSTGAGDEGYLLAQTLGHTIVDVRPALVPLSCDFPYLNRVRGVRAQARISLLEAGKEIASDIGELQWTKYGLSGIVIFQLSRYIKKNQGPYELIIDFLPDTDEDELAQLFSDLAGHLDREAVSVLLRGIIHEKMIRIVLGQADLENKTCRDLNKKDLHLLAHTLKTFPVPVRDVRSFDQAQICAGGVDCREISEDLESNLHPGLYFAGEMLDVDGPCGGYNLQWAWTSGYICGSAAAENCTETERGKSHGG